LLSDFRTVSNSPTAKLNYYFLQVWQLHLPEHHANVLAMIEEFDLEIVGVERM
jgi:hypothetical protein